MYPFVQGKIEGLGGGRVCPLIALGSITLVEIRKYFETPCGHSLLWALAAQPLVIQVIITLMVSDA